MERVIDKYKTWRKKYCSNKEICEVEETDKYFLVKKLDNWNVKYYIK